MLRQSPYETTLGSSIQTGNIKQSIFQASVRAQIPETFINIEDTVLLLTLVGVLEDVPLFSQPIVHTGSIANPYNIEFEYVVVIDQRPFVNMMGEPYKITNTREYAMQKIKGILTSLWVMGDQINVKTDSRIAGIVFVNLIANTVGNHYHLDPGAKLRIAVISSLYYGTLFTNKYKDPVAVTDAMRLTGAGSKLVEEILDENITFDGTTDSLARAITEHGGSIKLKKFNNGVLLTVLGNIFYGYNHKELIHISLEYPPIWIAMVYTVMNDRSFKNTYLAKLALSYAKRGVGDSLSKLIQQHI